MATQPPPLPSRPQTFYSTVQIQFMISSLHATHQHITARLPSLKEELEELAGDDKHIPTQAFLDRIAYIRKLKTERRRMGTELDNLKIEFLLTKAEEGLEAIKQKMNRDPKEIQTPEGA